MSAAVMSPNIKRLFDQILSSFNIEERVDDDRSDGALASDSGDSRVISITGSKSKPSKAFVNSVRKRARAS